MPPGHKPPGRVPVLSCDAEETEQHSAAGREGSRPGSPHRSGFLRLDTAERPADPASLRGAPVTPSRYRQHPLLWGEALSMPAGPLTKSHSQRTRLPARPAPMSRVVRGQGACRHWAPGGPVNPPGSHRSRSLGRHPHLKTILSLGRPPQGARSQVPSVQRVKTRPSVFSTSQQGQRSRHADAEDSAGSGGAAASLPLDVSGHDGLWPPRGSALLAPRCSSEVVASLHGLDV